eukprot:SAG22_NODE_12764_length_430_cov_0.864048_1_plen_113_part_10
MHHQLHDHACSQAGRGRSPRAHWHYSTAVYWQAGPGLRAAATRGPSSLPAAALVHDDMDDDEIPRAEGQEPPPKKPKLLLPTAAAADDDRPNLLRRVFSACDRDRDGALDADG